MGMRIGVGIVSLRIGMRRAPFRLSPARAIHHIAFNRSCCWVCACAPAQHQARLTWILSWGGLTVDLDMSWSVV